jgi:phosphoserine phosphatase RsbU/P
LNLTHQARNGYTSLDTTPTVNLLYCDPAAFEILADDGRSMVERLAPAWQGLGASFFGIWNGASLIAGWPENNPPTAPELVAPLKVYDRIIGYLGVNGPNIIQQKVLLESEAGLMSSWAQAEFDLRCMTADLCESQDQLLALYELSRNLRNSIDLQQILETLLRQAVRLTEARLGFLWHSPPDEPIIHTEFPPALITEAQENALFEKSRASGKAMLLDRDTLTGELLDELQVLYLIPIQIGGKITTAMGLFFNHSVAALSPYLKLAQAIARQSETYIENARLHRDALRQTKLLTELDLARQIQTRLLPQNLPSAPGIETAAFMRPANEVGGDFYDFIKNPDHTFFFTLGDAAGKGMPAALLMSMTHTVFKSAARVMSSAGPQALLSSGLADLYDDFTETGLFVTVFVGKYMPEQRSLLYANAGHAPVIFRPAGGTARILEADAPPLGVLPTSLSDDHRLPIHPGDLLIAATDGFNEANNEAGEMLGYERLLELTDSLYARSAAEIVTAFYQAVDEFCPGRPQEDDQTIIVIKGI